MKEELKDYDKDYEKYLRKRKKRRIILYCFEFSLIILTIVVTIIGMHRSAQEEIIPQEKTYLTSIDYQNNISGAFVLGIGSIRNTGYYAAYQELSDGGLKLVKLESDITVVYQDLKENEKAYFETRTDGLGTVKSIKLYVPKNTIKQEYSFNN